MDSVACLVVLLTCAALGCESRASGSRMESRIVDLLTVSDGGGRDVYHSTEQRTDSGSPQALGTSQCGFHFDRDLGQAVAFGHVLAIVVPEGRPAQLVWRHPELHCEAMGVRFDARVLQVATNRTELPRRVEVHQWNTMSCNGAREPMQPTDDSPSRANPREGSQLLVLLRQDNLGPPGGWLLAHSWHVRSDGTVEGSALGSPSDASFEFVLSRYREHIGSTTRIDREDGGIQ